MSTSRKYLVLKAVDIASVPLAKPAIIVFIAWIVSLSSGLAEASTVFTWDQSVDRVRQTNDAIQAASSKLESIQQQETVTRSSYFPILTGSYSAGYEGEESFSDPSKRSSLSLSLSQNLFAGLQDYGRLKQSKANTRAAESDLIAAKSQASYDLKANFEGYTYATSYVTLASQIIKRREDNLQMVQLRYESGRENKGSAMLSKANLAQAQYDLVIAQNSLRTARYGLATVLAIDEPESFEVSGTVPTSNPSATPSFLDLLPAVPEHLRALATEESAEYGVTVARSGFFPSLDLTGSVGKSSSVDFTPDNQSWSLGLRLTFNLFSGLSDLGSIRSASANYRASTSTRRNLDRTQLSALVQAYNKYVEAVTKYKVDQNFREAAQVRAEIGRKRYNNGLLSFEDWDVIENDLINRQKAFLQSKRDRVIAEAAWERAQGRSAIP